MVQCLSLLNYHGRGTRGVCFCFLFLIFSFFYFFPFQGSRCAAAFQGSRCAAASNEIIARCSLMYSVDKEVRSAVRVCVCVSSAHAVCVCSAHANARSCVSVMCPPKSS